MPELGYEFGDGTGYRELNLYLVGLTVDGVTVWEKPKPKEREAMDINALAQDFDIRARALKLQQEMFRQWERDPGTRGTLTGFADPKAQALYDALCAFTAPVPKPKERVRVHPEREHHTFLKEDGEYDVYLFDIPLEAGERAPYYFPAVYEER